MGYQVLVTLDLPEATEQQRSTFYQVLEQEHWEKIDTLTTAWRVRFRDGGTREGAAQAIRNHIRNAREASRVRTVEYALQLDTQPVIVERQ
jgi:hypothetical protein